MSFLIRFDVIPIFQKALLSMRFYCLGLSALGLAIPAMAQTVPYLHAPSVDTYATFDPSGETIMTTGRILKPVGTHVPLERWPHGLVLSPDGKTAFVASEGVGQLVKDWESGAPTMTTLTPEPFGLKKKRSNTGAAAFSPDGKTLYWSGGESGDILLFDLATGKQTGTISLNVSTGGKTFEDSFVLDAKLSADGKYLYCADVANFRLATISTETHAVVSSVPTGRYPYALALSGNQVYVANIGQFEYSAIPLPGSGAFDKRGLTRPAFGYPSKEAEEGGEFEGRKIPGLGDPNTLDAFSVWGIDVTDPARPRVTRKVKTGLLVGAPADNGKTVGGSAPNSLAVHGNFLYVSDDNNDLIEKLDLATGKIVKKTRISPSPLVGDKPFRLWLPFTVGVGHCFTSESTDELVVIPLLLRSWIFS